MKWTWNSQITNMNKSTTLLIAILFLSSQLFAQDDLLKLVDSSKPTKEYVTRAFKSSRVINSHSIEMIPKGNMDFRILHRFGLVNTGGNNLWGLDQANMRFGFDYGLLRDLTVGIGRTNVNKEFDGFLKYRPLLQSKGPGSWPVAIVLVGGMTYTTMPWADPTRQNYNSSRIAYYGQILIGRKLNEMFSLQLGPTMVHRNLVPLESDKNDAYAIEMGGRMKVSRRVAFVVDYSYIISGVDKNIYTNPLGVGVDIETGGHVFQLHFSNSEGMNEKELITNTTGKWGQGEVRFGFNLSRMFVIDKKAKHPNW
jgi:hypothetical protein